MSITARDITNAYQKNVDRVEQAKAELDKAQEKFNRIYTDSNKEGKEVQMKFSNELFDYITSRVNVRDRGTYVGSGGLTEIFLDEGNNMEKISFHNRQWVSNVDGEFTFMIRDYNMNTVEGEIDPDMTPEEAGEFILSEYEKSFK